MPDSPPTTCFADQACYTTAEISRHEQIARDTYLVRVECVEIARRIAPGQFLMMRLPEGNDPLLARPLALYDTVLGADGRPSAIDVVYLTVGKFTRRLAVMPVGGRLELWGPLGNGFAPQPANHLVIAAGGIGQTPFMALAREALGLRSYGDPPRTPPRCERVTLCYGVRSAAYLAGVAEFESLGVEVRISTDDGTAGHRGFVTDIVRDVLAVSGTGCRIVCCGPEPMMAAVARLAQKGGVPCQVSLETPMACGLGICFSCVARVSDGAGGWDYRRTCVEGPVFDATQILF
jgi:dihydroorotate dehydrogenase electron transfer subunit